jgi:hypothetical protein
VADYQIHNMYILHVYIYTVYIVEYVFLFKQNAFVEKHMIHR